MQNASSTDTRRQKRDEWLEELASIEEALLGEISVSEEEIQKVLKVSNKALSTMEGFSKKDEERDEDEAAEPPSYSAVRTGLEELREWVENGENIRSLTLAPTTFPGKDFFARHSKKYVFGRIKEKVDGLIDFIRKPYNWRYGLFHHNLFLPFIGKN
jgi:hypothetical protein